MGNKTCLSRTEGLDPSWLHPMQCHRPMMNLKVKKWWTIEIIGSFWDDFRVDCYWCMRTGFRMVSPDFTGRCSSDPRPKNFKHLPRPLRRVRFWKPKSADMWKRHEITGNYHFKDVVFKVCSIVFVSFQQVLECFPPGLCGGTPSNARTVFSLLKVWRMRWWRLRPSIPRCSWYHRWIRGIFCWICGVPPFQRDFWLWSSKPHPSGWWHMDKWATWRNHTWFPSWHFPMFSDVFVMPFALCKQGPRPGFQALRRSNAARDAALKAQKVALEGWRWCKSDSTVLVVGSQPMVCNGWYGFELYSYNML